MFISFIILNIVISKYSATILHLAYAKNIVNFFTIPIYCSLICYDNLFIAKLAAVDGVFWPMLQLTYKCPAPRLACMVIAVRWLGLTNHLIIRYSNRYILCWRELLNSLGCQLHNSLNCIRSQLFKEL